MVPKFYLYLCSCAFAFAACASSGSNSAQQTPTSPAAHATPAGRGAEVPVAAAEPPVPTPLAAVNVAAQATAPPSPQEQAARAKEQTPKKKADACELITKSEIKSVQGADVGEAKGSERPSGPFILSQCYYTAAPFNKSVSLEVTRGRADPGGQGRRTLLAAAFQQGQAD